MTTNQFEDADGRGADGTSSESRLKVNWTDEEYSFVTREAVRLHIADPTQSLLIQCQRIIEQLPKDRRRTLVGGWTANEKLCRYIRAAMKEAVETKAPAVSPPPAQPSPPSAPEPPVIDVERIIDGITTETLTAILIGRFAGRMTALEQQCSAIASNVEGLYRAVSRLGEAASSMRPSGSTATVQVSASVYSAPALPRFVIYGLLARVQQEIRQRMKGRADVLEGWTQDGGKLMSVPKADWYLMAADFVSHDIQNRLYADVPREKVLRINGTVSGFIAVMEQLLTRTIVGKKEGGG